MKIAPLYPFTAIFDGPKNKIRWCFVTHLYLGPLVAALTQCGGKTDDVVFLEAEITVNSLDFCIGCRAVMVERGLIKE